ncbi:hypothetical protein ACQ4PT_034848 [Festuca glaucescens]
MEVKVVSSKLVKPRYPEGAARPDTTEHVPSLVFDMITYHIQMAIIYAFSEPAPSTADIERGLADVLALYRLFAGQVNISPAGALGVLLNDRGARLVEACVDGATLADAAPSKPTPELLKLHPDLDGEMEEVVQVQLTRFACGSLAIGFTANHAVADGHATSDFLVAWGRAARGLAVSSPPHNHPDLFRPRDPPLVEFEHRGVEYRRPTPNTNQGHHGHHGSDNVVIHKAHFTKDFIAVLRAKASEGRGRPFSRGEGLQKTAVLRDVLGPDMEVDSWLSFPFHELDFGTGGASYFMPAYFPTEGKMFLVPSYIGDGSVNAFVPVFDHNLDAFKQCCYSME